MSVKYIRMDLELDIVDAKHKESKYSFKIERSMPEASKGAIELVPGVVSESIAAEIAKFENELMASKDKEIARLEKELEDSQYAREKLQGQIQDIAAPSPAKPIKAKSGK